MIDTSFYYPPGGPAVASNLASRTVGERTLDSRPTGDAHVPGPARGLLDFEEVLLYITLAIATGTAG
jgi:hypothetical protein